MTTATLPATTIPPEPLLFLWEAWAAKAVLAASFDLGIIDRLEKGPVDAAVLVRDCGIREEAAPALLRALTSLGLVERDHGSFGLAGELNWFWELLRRWDSFPDGLRRRPEASEGGPIGADGAFSRTVGPLATLIAPAVGPATEVLRSTGPRVLDLGAGAAPWSLALAAADPDVTVTAVDLPAVLPVTAQAVAAAGRDAQFHLLEGDMFTVNLSDGAFDLVILGSVCHLVDQASNRRLLGRVARWLRPGGTVAIIDFLPDENGDGPRNIALYGVELTQRMPAGQLYPFSSYTGWLREAGLERIERLELAACPPITLVRSRRPALPCDSEGGSS